MANIETNIEKIEVRIEREETKLKSYLQRKQELESQIQEVKKIIEDLKAEVKVEKMTHADNVASGFGITPEDYELALITGDFSIIQEKRQKALEAKAALEADTTDTISASDVHPNSYYSESASKNE